MNFKKMLLASIMTVSMFAAVGCKDKEKESGPIDVTLWVSETEGVKELTKTQVERFAAAEGLNLNVTVEGVTEADSATKMLTDVEAGADIYCFAQDQFARLVQGGALSKLGQAAAAEVTANNIATTVESAKSGEDLYAYPLTSDNGYFMYYDKSVITNEDHLTSLEDLVADCEAAGKNFSMEFETSGWYLASWFFSVDESGNHLCKSEWTTDDDGKFIAVSDTFNSANGLIAAKGAQKLVKSPNFVSSSATGDLSAETPSAILISGTWAYSDVLQILGENMGVAELPSFTVGGQSYHMGSYSGCKLMGVKPTEDPARSAMLHKIARFLTNEECQLERFNAKGWGPSNKAAAQNEAVLANPALTALGIQNEYAIPQGQIHGSWWDISKVLGASIKAATNDAEINEALQAYYDSIDGVLHMSDDVADAFTVIGDFEGGAGWSKDAPMTFNAGSKEWKTNYPMYLKKGNEFKVRKGLSWDEAYGTDGNNFVVGEDDGFYYVVLNTETHLVSLEAVTADYGWSVCGDFNSWGADVDMELVEGVFTAEIEVATAGGFKLKFNHDWAINLGVDAKQGGDNIAIEAGTHTITFNQGTGVIAID